VPLMTKRISFERLVSACVEMSNCQLLQICLHRDCRGCHHFRVVMTSRMTIH